MFVANIALPISLPFTFDYLFSCDMNIKIGCRVRVPLKTKHCIGIVVNINNKSKLPNNKLKNVIDVLDEEPIYTPSIWKTLLWAVDYYHHPIGNVLFHALPILLRQGKDINYVQTCYWFITKQGLTTNVNNLKCLKQKQALKRLRQDKIWLYQIKTLDLKKSTLESLQKKGLCKLVKETPKKSNWKNNLLFPKNLLYPNVKKSIIIHSAKNFSDSFSVWLLTDVTEFDRTEIYLDMLKDILARGKQVLIMVPEIDLILKIVFHLRKYLNVPIETLHSEMSDYDQLQVWIKAKKGEIAIVVGTRLSLFTPFKNLGIIILDEEHNNAYKQKKGWRYHARDLAIYRARIEHVPIVLSSIAPTLETLYNVYRRKYHLLRLRRHIKKKYIIIKHIIDIRGKKTYAGLSLNLIKRMNQHLQANNQIILFLNHRGFTSTLLCHDCGETIKCTICDHNYTLHQEKKQLRCPCCGNKRLASNQCYTCGSTNLISVGLGTEQLEKSLELLFPDIPISRFDSDTINRRNMFEQSQKNTYQNGAHILVGTRMLIKRYCFSNVTLVAFLNVDKALLSTNFRSSEHFAQLYTQIIDRIGQENKKIEVILQTYYPEHLLLQILLKGGYKAFSKQLLKERQIMHLPPWTNHVLMRAEDRNNKQASIFLEQIRSLLQINLLKDNQLFLFGPMPILKSKKNGRYFWKIILQHPSRSRLQYIVNNMLNLINTIPKPSGVKWILDVNPIED